jgi:hypothetical protein
MTMSLPELFDYIGKNSGKYRNTNVDAQTDDGASEHMTGSAGSPSKKAFRQY